LKYLVFLLLFCQISLFAKWLPLGVTSLEKISDVIVVAQYHSEINSTKMTFKTIQFSNLKKVKIIKGDIDDNFIVKTFKTMACVPNYLFPNKKNRSYLLFLRKIPNTHFYSIVNGSCGALPIINHTIKPCRNDHHTEFYGLSIKTAIPEP